MTINLADLNKKQCEKIDGANVDAYIELAYDPNLDTGIIIKNTWGDTGLDLEPIIKAGETDTKLFLAPTTKNETKDWTYLQYNSEDSVWCIEGDDLSRIISMKKLKDVSQTAEPTSGDIYMFNGDTNLFEIFNLQNYMDEVKAILDDHETRITSNAQNIEALQQEVTNIKADVNNALSRITALEQTVANHETRIAALEKLTTRPDGVPTDTVLAWGNRNIYGDYANAGSRSYGIFTHSTSTTLSNDQYFS